MGIAEKVAKTGRDRLKLFSGFYRVMTA